MAPVNDTHIENFFIIYGHLDDDESAVGFDNYFEEYINQVGVAPQQVVQSITRHDAADAFNKFLPDTFFYMMDPHSHIFDRSITVNNIPINDIIFQIVDNKKVQIHEVMYHIVKYIYDIDKGLFKYLEDWIFNKKQFYQIMSNQSVTVKYPATERFTIRELAKIYTDPAHRDLIVFY
jgi:hypothetical protein